VDDVKIRPATVTEDASYQLGRETAASDCLEALDELHRFMMAGASESLTDDGTAVLVALRVRLARVRDNATAAREAIARAIRPA